MKNRLGLNEKIQNITNFSGARGKHVWSARFTARMCTAASRKSWSLNVATACHTIGISLKCNFDSKILWRIHWLITPQREVKYNSRTNHRQPRKRTKMITKIEVMGISALNSIGNGSVMGPLINFLNFRMRKTLYVNVEASWIKYYRLYRLETSSLL